MLVLSKSTPPGTSTGTLELKATKESAHSGRITSVAYSPNGKTIVSGSWDKAIKVWDAGALAPTPRRTASALAADASSACLAGTLELKATKENAHIDWVTSVAFNPDGKTIVSGSYDQTIKVWDGALPTPQITFSWPKLTIPVLPHLHSVPERDRIN